MALATAAPSREDFAAMLEDSFTQGNLQEGSVIKGTVVAIEKDIAVIDVGLKTEGRVAAQGIHRPGPANDLKVGDAVEVYLERVENALGEAVLSRDKARREESWGKLEKAFRPTRRSPASSSTRSRAASPSISTAPWPSCRARQVDIRPIRDVTPADERPQPFQILKMDRRRGNIVVSRRTVLEETRAEQRQELVQNLEEGQVIDGVVKNITDYGAFVDLGGIDGLLHVTDIAWRRVNHPTEVLNIGQTVKVKIIKINHETHRISLGMKQLLDDPWQGIEAKYPGRRPLQGPRHQHHRLRRVRRTGAGHRRPHPRLRNVVDQEERASRQDRLDLAGSRSAGARGRSGQAPHLARPQADPAQSVGSLRREVSGRARSSRARSRTRPSSACSSASTATSTAWSISPISTGSVRASRSSTSTRRATWSRPRCSTSTSRRSASRSASSSSSGDPLSPRRPATLKKGAVVTCEVTEVKDGGIDVKIVGTDLTAFIKRTELARDRSRPAPRALRGRREGRRPRHPVRPQAAQGRVSIKALEVAEEKEAIAQYGSSDSGASLGDILGAALKRAHGEKKDEDRPGPRISGARDQTPADQVPGVFSFRLPQLRPVHDRH